MTQINIHGILSKEFGQSMTLRVRRVQEIVSAIAANKPNFRHRIIELSREGIHYAIIKDGVATASLSNEDLSSSPHVIDIIPVICGHGVAVAVAGIAVMAGGAAVAAGGSAIIGGLIMSLGGMMLGMGLQMALAPKPEAPDRIKSTISGGNNSLMLSSKGNVAQQGSPVPIAYGRLRIGSAIIQTSLRSYPMQSLNSSSYDDYY